MAGTRSDPTGSPNVVLVGFMGSGKSTVGRLVAHRFGYSFVDIDEVIEAGHGPIPQLFERLGEPGFRAIEAQVAQAVASSHATVIATGGGTMGDTASAAALEASGAVVWLDASPETILRRLGSSSGLARRPLLANDPEATVRRLLLERAPLYCHYRRVGVDDATHAQVADAVVQAALEQWSDEGTNRSPQE